MMKGEDIDQTIFISQDRDENRGNKSFSKFPLKDMNLFVAFLKQNSHTYEILPSQVLVKPYFDLEMEGENLTENEIQRKAYQFHIWLMKEIKRVFGIIICITDFVILNSSREKKLSYHSIIHNKICFESVSDLKIFIYYLTWRFENPNTEERELFAQLTYTAKDGKQRFIFDKAPYGKDQNYRCVNQSKKGKPYTLKNQRNHPLEDTLVRLYYGAEGRTILNVTTLNQLLPSILQSGCLQKKDEILNNPIIKAIKNVKQLPVKSDFVTTGLTLFQFKQLTLEQMKLLPRWKQALYLIPNSAQDWEIYRNIAMAVRSVGGTQADLIEWAKLNPKFDSKDQVIKDFHKFRVKPMHQPTFDVLEPETHTFDLPYLLRLAKSANPDYFKQEKTKLDYYFQQDVSNIQVIEEHSQFVSQQGTPNENNIFLKNKVLVLNAYLGRGKTTAIKRMLQDTISYLFLSPRQTFSKFISSEFGIPCYLNGDYNHSKLVVSVESLHNIKEDIYYDTIVLDECESILNQFSSHTCNGRHIQIFNKLNQLIKQSKKVVLADAFITNRTLNFCRSLEEEVVMIKNNTSPVNRVAEEIHNNLFTSRLLESLKKREKNYACFSSYKALIQSMENLQADEVGREILDYALIYHAKTDDKLIHTIETINQSWKDASFVATSPINTIGCSYSVPDDFDNVFVNGMPTCCVRDTFQTQMRVRHLKQNKMIFALPEPKQLQFFKSSSALYFDVLEEYLEHNKFKKSQILQTIDDLVKQRKVLNLKDECNDLLILKTSYENEDTPFALKQILFFNLYEQVMSKKFYKEMFYEFLTRCGYTIEGIKEKKKSENDLPSIIQPHLQYENLKTLTFDEMEIAKKKINRKLATELEKLQYEKYWFHRLIRVKNEMKTEDLSHLFHQFYLSSYKREILKNIVMENRGSVEELLEKDNFESGSSIEVNKNTALKFKIIKEFLNKLGLENTYTKSQFVTRKQVESMMEYLQENRKQIHMIFELKDYSKQTLQVSMKYEQCIKLINKIFNSWSESSLDVHTKNSHTKKAIDYSLKVADQSIPSLFS